MPQVLESLHDTIKDALPRNIHQKEPSTAISKLGFALEAVALARGWIDPATEQHAPSQMWVFNDQFEKEITPSEYLLGSFSPAYVSGPPAGKKMVTEHLLLEDEEHVTQRKFFSQTTRMLMRMPRRTWGSRSPITADNGIPAAAPGFASTTSALCW